MQNVLVAEDDRILRKRIIRAISNKSAGVTVYEVGTGWEAIDLIEGILKKGQSMDAVITDIQMPKLSGLMVLSYLNAFAPKVPCFVITSYGTARLKSKLRSDLFRFYDKPFDVEELAIAVVAVLNRQQAPDTCGGINLLDFISIVENNRATATITVTQQGHPPCKLFMKDGEIIDAVGEDKRGEPAAILALSRRSANYAIDFGIPDDIERTIKTPLKQLFRTVSSCFDKA